jgi:hypothetical protein
VAIASVGTFLTCTIPPRAFWLKLQRHLPRRGFGLDDGASAPDFYRNVWGEAAAALGLSVTDIGGQFFDIRCPGSVLRICRNFTSLDDQVTVAIAANKPLVHQLLAARHVPLPAHLACSYRNATAAWAFVSQRGRPCVVKPAKGTGGGMGITIDVSTKSALVAAMGRAGSYCGELLIEEQIPGDNYRLLYLDGTLIEALRRRPPLLLGDGTSTVKELVSTDMSQDGGVLRAGRASRHGDRRIHRLLAQTGRAPNDVPAAGEPVRLRRVIDMDDRQDNESVTNSICAAIVQSGAAAAAAVGVRLAGVDVITPDHSIPLEGAGGAVIEVNTGPGLHYHYMTTSDPAPVASLILRQLCDTAAWPT